MRVAWATDIHLDMLSENDVRRFARSAMPCEVFLLTGDLSVSSTLIHHLALLAEESIAPLFVLGNHDFYGDSVSRVRRRMVELPAAVGHWLPGEAPVALNESWVCTGVDGFGDARAGNVSTTPVVLNDTRLIEDLLDLDPTERNARLQALGDADAALAARLLEQAASMARCIVFLTHVPPFSEVVLYDNKPGDPDWLPFFTNVSLGDVLHDFASRHPKHQVLVLCGHTHHAGVVRPLPNLKVHVGHATYGHPEVTRIDLLSDAAIVHDASSLS